MQNPIEFKKYIQKQEFITNEDDNNYQFIPGKGEPGWKLKVPFERQDEFLTTYYTMKVKNDLVSGLLEKPHPEYNQIRIDGDLKYMLKTNKSRLNNKHQYKISTIEKLISKYIEITSEYITIPSKGVNFTLFEKPKSTIKGGIKESEQYIKDGFHIVCPDLVIDNTILHAIYDDIINDKQCKEIVSEFESDEDISKVIDKAVISTNSWFLLGSGKPSDNPDSYYKISKNYLVKFDETNNKSILIEKDINMNHLEQVIYYSNYNKNKNTKEHDTVNISVLEKRLNSSKNKKKEVLTDIDRLELQNRSKHNNTNIDLKYIEHLVDCLSDERVSTYDLWFKVGVCLFNISGNLYSLFEKWSSKWERFNRDDVYREWYGKISNYGAKYSLGLTQLKRYAQEDDPKKFFKITNLEKQNFINKLIDEINNQPTLNGKPSLKKVIGALDMAKTITDYINIHCDWNIKCADNTGSCIWYKFDNGLWREDKGANKIHQLFSKELGPALKKTYQYWTMKLIEREGNNIGADYNDEPAQDSATNEIYRQVIQNKLSTILQINEFLQKPANRNNLIKDISQESYDSEFYKQLNENRDIFVCNNCVLDLENLEIRKGLPEDMSTIKTDIDFPINIDTEEAQEYMSIITDLLDKIYPDYSVQEHVMNIFAESLSGVQRREKFHIHTGSGGNGKSVMFDLLHLVFGEYSYSPDATIFSFNNDNPNAVNPTIANCKGKRLIDTGEPKASTPFDVSGIKKMTGGDKLTGRHLNKEPISFKSQASWHVATNDVPEFDGPADGGIERRAELIHYVSKFVPNSDRRLSNPEKYPFHYPADDKFRNETYLKKLAPYFLRMLWEKYIYLKSVDFAPLLDEENIPAAIREFTDDYIKSSNAIDQFITECIEAKEGWRQKEKEIFNEFKKYANDTTKKFNKTAFIRHFERRIGTKIRADKRVRYCFDFVVINQGEEYES
jgi:phage/plasmid-associated DNA primase